MLRWIVLLLASLLSAQGAPAPKYKVVKSGKIEQAVAAVNTLADQGYRLLVPGPLFIMRLESTPRDTYRYVAMNQQGGPVQLLNWVNEQGAHGYRLVPEAGVLEKEPHPKNYEYSIPAPPSRWGKTDPDAIPFLIRQGYRPIGSVYFPVANGLGDTQVYYQRDVGAKPESMPAGEER